MPGGTDSDAALSTAACDAESATLPEALSVLVRSAPLLQPTTMAVNKSALLQNRWVIMTSSAGWARKPVPAHRDARMKVLIEVALDPESNVWNDTCSAF